MQVQTTTTITAEGQIRQTVSAALGCQPRQTPEGWTWGPRTESGIRSAVLRPHSGGLQELDLVLASVPETAGISVRHLWELAAVLIKETDLTAVPISPTRDASGGNWQITARLTLSDTAFDLPRLNRLNQAIDLLDHSAKTIQAELPVATGLAPEIPRQLKDIVQPLTAHMKQDSDVGNVCRYILPHIESGLTVAVVGAPLRIQLELDRLARIAPNIAVLQHPTPIQKLPQLARMVKQAGMILASSCSLLRPRVSVYEQGRELEGTLRELATSGLPMLAFGAREELESVFGVGQGRSHSPLLPVIQSLPAANGVDLVRAALAGRCNGLVRKEVDRLVKMVLDTLDRCAPGKNHLLQPLSNLAAERGPGDSDLPAALVSLAEDLAGRRDTFGTCDEAPASPRPPDVCRHLRQRLGGSDLEDLLRSRIFGQNPALCELARRIWQESICRPGTEPLRIMLAGPVATGKSVAVKYVAEALGYPCYYIDATAFDSEHSVMTSLAGASPGIVNSYNDGVLARISRRPSVVEIADLDHARPGVRGALCEFFLRILQEGTLQTGSGMIIRTLPSVIFIFTSNVAYGTHKADARFGFGSLTRDEVRQRVVSRALEHLGHAFVSRIGQPILFEQFTRQTAIEIAEMEIRSLVGRVTGVATIAAERDVSRQIVDSVPTLETGARGVIDAVRAALAEALRERVDMGAERVVVRLDGQQIVIEHDSKKSRGSRKVEQDAKSRSTRQGS